MCFKFGKCPPSPNTQGKQIAGIFLDSRLIKSLKVGAYLPFIAAQCCFLPSDSESSPSLTVQSEGSVTEHISTSSDPYFTPRTYSTKTVFLGPDCNAELIHTLIMLPCGFKLLNGISSTWHAFSCSSVSLSILKMAIYNIIAVQRSCIQKQSLIMWVQHKELKA